MLFELKMVEEWIYHALYSLLSLWSSLQIADLGAGDHGGKQQKLSTFTEMKEGMPNFFSTWIMPNGAV